MIEILLPAITLSLVLVGIHAYFGLEIIRRGIIFTDLAIGQMAALGAALAILWFHGEYLYGMGVGFALLGGLLVALASGRERYLEAYIALVYALASSATVLVLSKSPHGTEALQTLLAADILFTGWEEVLHTAVLYGVIGLVLGLAYGRSRGMVREVIFFTTFALTVASSVSVAGVLVVFVMLVAPAFMVIKSGVRTPLIWAWAVGTLLSVLGVGISYGYDFPTGYMIVFVHALAAIITALIFLLKERPWKS